MGKINDYKFYFKYFFDRLNIMYMPTGLQCDIYSVTTFVAIKLYLQ
jgi:hypothetical protein